VRTIFLFFLLPLGVAGQGGFFQVRLDVPAPLRAVNVPEQNVDWFNSTGTSFGLGVIGEWVQPITPRIDAVFSTGLITQSIWAEGGSFFDNLFPPQGPYYNGTLGAIRHVQLETGVLWKLFTDNEITFGLEASIAAHYRWLNDFRLVNGKFSYQKTSFPLGLGFRGIGKYVSTRIIYEFVPDAVFTQRSLSKRRGGALSPSEPSSTWVDTRLYQQGLVFSVAFNVLNCYVGGKELLRK